MDCKKVLLLHDIQDCPFPQESEIRVLSRLFNAYPFILHGDYGNIWHTLNYGPKVK